MTGMKPVKSASKDSTKDSVRKQPSTLAGIFSVFAAWLLFTRKAAQLAELASLPTRSSNFIPESFRLNLKTITVTLLILRQETQNKLRCKMIVLNSETCNRRKDQVDFFYSPLDEDFRLLIWLLRERRISWGWSSDRQFSDVFSADCSGSRALSSDSLFLSFSLSFSFDDLNFNKK